MSSQKTLVLFTLAVANTPLTVGELAFRCGKSYNTVKKILTGDDRVMVFEGHPTRYSFDTPDVLNEQVIRFEFDAPEEGWVSWVRKVAPRLSQLVTLDKSALSDDVYKQAVVVEALGINLVQFARQLRDNKDKPDWFTIMGGDENDG